MKLKKSTYIAATVCALWAVMSSAHAQGNVTATIKEIAPDDTQPTHPVLFVYPSSLPTGSPACATDPERYVIDATVNPAMVAAILTAYATGSKVDFIGTGACDVWAGAETLRYAIIAPS